MSAPLTEAEILVALRARWPKGEAAILPQVGNETGGARRYADAVVMTLWRSRGLLLEGVEIKRFRSDWLREKKDPRKAEAIYRFCDRWWVVAPPGVVQKDELPETWGLLVVDGRSVQCERKAPALKPDAVTRPFLAALLRRLEQHELGEDELAAACERARDDGVERGQQAAAYALKAKDRTIDELRARQDKLYQTINAFEQAAGVSLRSWRNDERGAREKRVGELVRLIMHDEPAVTQQLASFEQRVKEFASTLTAVQERLASALTGGADG